MIAVGCALVNRPFFERASAEEPDIVGGAFVGGNARLPNRRAGVSTVGKDSNLGDAALMAPFDDGQFRDRRRQSAQERDLWQIGGGNAEEQIIVVGADRASPRLNNIVGFFAVVLQDATAGEQVLTEATDQVGIVDGLVEVPLVEKDRLTR